MMTEKLYYKDSHLFSFEAEVLSCEETAKGTAVTLTATAFFPEGGGQQADTGYLNGIRVTDVKEKNGEILHYVAEAIAPGTCVKGEVDSEQRLRRMQNHSGEHVLSGLVHQNFGYENVGFHMGDSFMTIDFSGELSAEDVKRMELLANRTVRNNVPVRTYFPESSELKNIEYRSKLDLTENVRLVEIEGIDLCACCAPHVYKTGEIGIIKILNSERHRGGMRLQVVCGLDALDYINMMQDNIASISAQLSAKWEKTSAAVEKLLAEQTAQKEKITAMSREVVRSRAAAVEAAEGNICVFEPFADEVYLRELVNALVPKCGAIVAAFAGSDDSGYRYVMGSSKVDLRKESKAINAAINGRGGGKSEMIQGSAFADEETIRKYFG